MFNSTPAPFELHPQCDPHPKRWCNIRGYGNTLFEHAHNARSHVQPNQRLEPIHNEMTPAKYLNHMSTIGGHSNALQPIVYASCRNTTPPQWCVPAGETLRVQEKMFEDISFDYCKVSSSTESTSTPAFVPATTTMSSPALISTSHNVS